MSTEKKPTGELLSPEQPATKHVPYSLGVKKVQAAFGDLFGYAELTRGYGDELLWWCYDQYGDSLAIAWEDDKPINLYGTVELERVKGYFCLGESLDQVEALSTAHERIEWQNEFCERVKDTSLWPEAWRKEMEQS